MSLLAVWTAALALVGAPRDATIACWPTLSDYDGYAYIAERYVVVGPNGCATMLISAMTPRERDATQDLNTINLGWIQGEGLITIAHEAAHLAVGPNECQAERIAVRVVVGLIRRFVPVWDRRNATESAKAWDTHLRPIYHTGC